MFRTLLFALTLALAFVLPPIVNQSGAAPVATQRAFCGIYGKVCRRVCTDGPTICQTKCLDRKRECFRTGCFDLWTQDRCFNNAKDRELTDPKYSPRRR